MVKADSKAAGHQKRDNSHLVSKGKPAKLIQKTIDLVKSNDQRKRSTKGKGKEKEILGDLTTSVERERLHVMFEGMTGADRAERRPLPGGIQVERFAEVRNLGRIRPDKHRRVRSRFWPSKMPSKLQR